MQSPKRFRSPTDKTALAVRAAGETCPELEEYQGNCLQLLSKSQSNVVVEQKP